MKTVFITGADRGLGLAMTKGLLENGCRVFAGQFLPQWPELAALKSQHPDALTILPLDVGDMESIQAAADAVGRESGSLDVLISNAGILSNRLESTIRQNPDYDGMLAAYQVNALGPLRVTEALLPLLDRGEGKRLCYVSSEAGSIGKSYRTGWFGYCMSKSALNMGVSILFNDLTKDGYTFRVYHPGWVKSYMHGEKNEEANLEPEEAAAPALAYFLEPSGSHDEGKLVLRDDQGNEWPW